MLYVAIRHMDLALHKTSPVIIKQKERKVGNVFFMVRSIKTPKTSRAALVPVVDSAAEVFNAAILRHSFRLCRFKSKHGSHKLFMDVFICLSVGACGVVLARAQNGEQCTVESAARTDTGGENERETLLTEDNHHRAQRMKDCPERATSEKTS